MPSEKSAVRTTVSPTTEAAEHLSSEKCTEATDTKSPLTSPSYDPTEYVQKQRITKMTPPKPAYNPLQFIQIKPCNLYQSAQDQLRKAEEVKKAKVTKKEEAEDWQGNLDSWKSSRRKRVEHIIERVVEVKKLEIEEHDRTRKKSKTFSEMMEERGGRRKISLPVYTEDESNDLSDLGIGTSSASGKSSMSEDFDNHSVISDNPDTEKSLDIDHHDNGLRHISSPGYETSSSTAPTASPDPLDYHQYQGNKQFSTKEQQLSQNPIQLNKASKESSPECQKGDFTKFVAKRPSVNKIEDRLVNFELKSSTSDSSEMGNGVPKKDMPKIDIIKRREMFETEKTPTDRESRSSGDFTQPATILSIKERLSHLERQKEEANTSVSTNRLSGDIGSIKDRLTHLEKGTNGKSTTSQVSAKFDFPCGSIEDRLSSLQSAKNAAEVSSSGAVPVSAKTAIVVGMAKKTRPCAEAIDQVVEVEQLKIQIEKIESTGLISTVIDEPESLMTMTSIQDVVQDYVTIMQDVKDKEEYREITDEDLFGGTDIDAADEVEIDNLQQDISVLEALDIAFDAIDKDDEDIDIGQKPVTTANNRTLVLVNRSPTTDQAAAAETTSTKCDHFFVGNECSNNTIAMDTDRDIEQFIDDLIKQTDQAVHGEEECYEQPQTVEDSASTNSGPTKIGIEGKRIVLESNTEPVFHISKDMAQPKPLKSVLKNPSKSLQKPQQNEPYYEVPPNRKPIPLYENVDFFLANETNQGQLLSTISAGVSLAPPKIKPPPPPVEPEKETDVNEDVEYGLMETPEENLKRMNSTKRIKKDIRIKRSSFLGIDSAQDDELDHKLSIAPPPDMSSLIEEERRLEKLFLKTYDGIVERSDSGVSESHSRQSSEPFTGSSEEPEDRSRELLDVCDKRREWVEESQMQNIEEQIREQEEVLRVERELLQIEQEELKRQRTNLLLQENYARRELEHGSKMLLSANRLSLQDINQKQLTAKGTELPSHLSSSTSSTSSSTFNVQSPLTFSMQSQNFVPMEYRQSMPNLQSSVLQEAHSGHQKPFGQSTGNAGIAPLTPPAKPSRQLGYLNGKEYSNECQNITTMKAPSSNDICNDFVLLRDHSQDNALPNQPGNMSRHILHALSAVPKPKLTDVWVQQQVTSVARNSELNNNNNKYFPIQRKAPITVQERMGDGDHQWVARKSDTHKGLGYGKHWLIQEAEQRRLDQQRGVRPTPNPKSWPIKSAGHLHRKSMPDISSDKKPLPEAVINTITQRLQSRMSVGAVVDKRRFDANPAIINSNASLDDGLEMSNPHGEIRQRGGSQEQVLSVSGKKKCSHCDEELGRGAAMIVESLRLFYHIDCFKCCVCLVRLGDGKNGTDVRVRNHKLHCQNCYSSDDGIKFSCV